MDQIEKDLRQEICDIGYKVWLTGMVAANDGNISVRLPNGDVLCTPTGVSKGSLTPEKICKVSIDGEVLAANAPYKPSSEVKVHLRLYQESEKVRSVVHAHPPYGTAFAIAGEPIISKMMPENIIAMPEIPVAPYATPSTYELAESIAPFTHTHSACLMEMHGALAWGDSLLSAYQAMERLEFTCKLTFLTRQLGVDRQLPDDEVEKLIGMRAQYGIC
ncbi:ribulose-5-phosphate 4-epimerase-like epimerase or aldolase [Corynebacterium mustelae]|uniref:Ribulose-5-phosphate 4-epimerase-like epimerase or aldolase n=1 Tax=Corynebacterium mustelae TaxID=571915 RepID=A0A0G3GUF6_9CORY|nr:class II aldolase/adducin family protein [Corynebacterium mustelae]AKK04806.1 ribulose-5-phosphate 4-epimerase-like epimerase or aldolase [Corynebacterium mustelae]